MSSSSPGSSRPSVTMEVLGSTGTRSSCFPVQCRLRPKPPRPTRGPSSRSGDPSTASRGCILEVATGNPLPTISASTPWSGPRWAAPFPTWSWVVPASPPTTIARAASPPAVNGSSVSPLAGPTVPMVPTATAAAGDGRVPTDADPTAAASTAAARASASRLATCASAAAAGVGHSCSCCPAARLNSPASAAAATATARTTACCCCCRSSSRSRS